ncbi:MAG TPA: DUF2330 domain-containing protein [Kofleriaceae bacterium]|nr:DUF2330 domain-containing protein [Kofleriaceae bacterium]
MRLRTVVVGMLALVVAPATADAFCGFYVSGADAKLYNNATMVVLMREGTRTVLSMQNNYQGPPKDFAMVVPVPVVLQKENVKVLPADVFDRVDQLAAPRLVEYWEQDPCRPPEPPMELMSAPPSPTAAVDESSLGVKIEAKFEVGEYQVVVLSAGDSTGLDTWLRREKYSIPKGAEPLLRPYVAEGMKFFVARVDIRKVKFVKGQAMLSPLRFHYDTQQFNLPIRLGLMNSRGTQDLLVHILSPGQRFEAANYTNVTIPTNLDVADATRASFPAFYAALFDRTMAVHKGSVVTEYSWDAASCDPCPVPPLEPNDLATLGGDVVSDASSFVLTRLHARYSADSLGDDLVFRAAPPIVGGRESMGANGQLERGAQQADVNNFQARYVIRHPWTGPVACASPQRGSWGGPPGGGDPTPVAPAQQIAFAPRNRPLSNFLRQDVDEIDYKVSRGDPKSRFQPSGIQKGGCAGCSAGEGGGASALALGGLLALGALRRRKPRGVD